MKCGHLSLIGVGCLVGILASAASPAAQSASDRVRDDATVPPAMVTHDANGRITLRATRLATPLAIDGRLDDEAYRLVPPAGDFIQQEPMEGEPATEKTDVWVFFDGENLYIAARCWDSQPDRLVANDMRRDGDFSENDNFTVTFDTFFDQRNGFFFQTNPLGGLRDQQLYDDRQNNEDWNTIWDVRTRRDERGWTVEMVIPFKSLRYRAGGPQTWGINFKRSIKWKNENSFLSPVPASYAQRAVFKMSSSGTLVGLEAPPVSRNVELKPYGKSGLSTDRLATPPFTNDLTGTGGLDAKYGLTSGLTADFTLNTDFAQVEADDQQVNLTRFNLFFPEKRDFFLEGQGIFAFGGALLRVPGGGGTRPLLNNVSENLTPVLFFSRRIGLNQGREVPIRAGGRVTGRAGPYTIGLLNIETGDEPAAGALRTNFSVVRLRRDVMRRSAVGLIATHRSLGLDGTGSNQIYGVDASLLLTQDLTINSYYARSRTPGVSGGDASYLAKFDYAADRYGLNVEHLTVGRGFNPEIGFMARDSFRRTYGYARFSPRPRSNRVFRKVSTETSLDYITDPDGRLQSRDALASLRLDFHNSDQWQLQFSRQYEDLKGPFEIASGVTIAPGGYGFQELRTTYYLGPLRQLTGRVNFSHGSFYDGNRTIASVAGRVNFGSRLAVEPRVSLNWVDLPAGRFTAEVLGARLTFAVTPRMAFTDLMQYNSSSGTLSSNIRFHWEYVPGSDLFVVYSDGRDTHTPGYPSLTSRSLVVKLTRLLRW